jgi:prepilin-type processing-associated H-X9-DG protein
MQYRRRRLAVTRIEVAVIAGIGLFCTGMLFLLLARQRETGLRAQCANNLRRIGEAIHSYTTQDKTPFLPPARIADGYATWAVLIVPHLTDKHPLLGWDTERSYFVQSAVVREAIVPFYFCPARERTSSVSVAGDIDPATKQHVPGAVGDYAGVAGTGAPAHPWDGADADGAIILGEVLMRQDDRILLWRGRTSLAAIQQGHGLSATLLIGEKHVPPDSQGRADAGDGSIYDGSSAASYTRVAGPDHGLASAVTDPFNLNFGSPHPGLCQFLMADGSVRPIAVNISDTVLAEMARRQK